MLPFLTLGRKIMQSKLTTSLPTDSESESESSNEHDKEEGSSKIGEQELRLALAALKAQSTLHNTFHR